MNKTILLIRHAQSANNALPECERVSDPALTALGTQQSHCLAERLESVPLSQIYCSPFRRSLDTAQPFSQRSGIKPIIKADIYEQGGCYSGYEPGKLRGEPGMCCAQLRKNYPGWEIDPLIGPRGWNVDREYESCDEVKVRAGGVANWLAHQWKPLREHTLAALVIHADFKRVLLAELLQTEKWPESWEPIGNTAVSKLQFDGHRWSMVQWNCVEHLPRELRTC